MEKWTVSEILDILVQSWTLKFHKVKLLKFKTFKFNQKYFSIMKKLWDLKKSSASQSWKDKGVALSWEWHAYFS